MDEKIFFVDKRKRTFAGIQRKVLVLNRMKHHDKYFVSENIYINGNWAAKSAKYYEEIAWMPIPSFDEILEANMDVLERIKEKGD